MPERVQRKRVKGWRMPANTVYVGRPSVWGNHWVVVRKHGMWGTMLEFDQAPDDFFPAVTKEEAQQDAVDAYRNNLENGYKGGAARIARELAGKNLACWCPLDQPCHADVLLELANKETK